MGKRCISSLVVGVSLAVFLSIPIVAYAVPPVFMPGFPMRAGTVAIIMWAPVPGATEYRVMKKVDNGKFQEAYRGPMNNFSDPAASPEKTIAYQVIAVVGGKESEPSKEVVLAGIKPLEPPEITGVLSDPGGLRVRWSVIPDAAFYNLYRADAEQGPYKLLTSLQDPQYFDREPKPGKKVYYQVSAIDKMNTESPKSKPVLGKIEEVVVVETFTPVYKEVTLKKEFRGQEVFELSKPVAMGFTRSGELVVMEEPGFQILDKEGNFLRRVTFEGYPPPHAAILDGEDRFYTTFKGSDNVHVLDLEGKTIRKFTIPPPKEAPKLAPRAGSITLDGERNIWVGDYVSHQIIVLNQEGKEIARFGVFSDGTRSKQDKDELEIAAPGRIHFSARRGEVWVVDSLNALIHIFDAKTRKFVKTIGGRKNKDGTDFQGVAGIIFKENGNILILDHMQGTLIELSSELKYVNTYVDPQEKPKKKLHVNYPSSLLFRTGDNEAVLLSSVLGTGWIYPLGEK